MKYIVLLASILFKLCLAIVQIELKKSVAKNHSDYLMKLKLMQINSRRRMERKAKGFFSFLEEKEIPLHQQVLAQKRLATYYGDINVGYGRKGNPSKTQNFRMLFDTGSCEFWIPSRECTTSRCLTHTRYEKSSTLKPYRNSKMTIQYLSGKVTGDMALETIGLGDLIVPDQVIGIAKVVEIPLLDEVIWDGILGLAYPNKNLQKKHIKPLFDTIISQNLLKNRGEKNQFSYYLGAEKGSISFGGADMRFKKNINEEFKWAPITERNYWTISLLDIKKYDRNNIGQRIQSNSYNSPICPNGCKSIVDTGTYLIYGPSDQLQNFLVDMTLDDCSKKHLLPTLGFVFKSFPVNGRESSFELILTPEDYVLEFDVNGNNDCVVGIGADNEDSGWTLGQVFLKAYYTVFDRETESIGFVRSNPDPFKMTPQFTNNSIGNTYSPPPEKILKNSLKKIQGKEKTIKHFMNNRVIELPKNYNGPFQLSDFINLDDGIDDRLSSLLRNN